MFNRLGIQSKISLLVMAKVVRLLHFLAIELDIAKKFSLGSSKYLESNNKYIIIALKLFTPILF